MHMKGGLSGDGVYLEYLKRMAHGCRKGAHECITHGCMAQGCQGCQELGVKTDVYVEYLKWCLKLNRELSIQLTHIPDLLIEQ